jgi:hypothetical protein
VIPEIPSIACKQNSSGKDIVERIQLNAPHGEYVYYQPGLDEAEIQSFFSPKRLFKLTIQLYAPNGELYDTQNSDNSFEFEITMVGTSYKCFFITCSIMCKCFTCIICSTCVKITIHRYFGNCIIS